MLSTSTDGPAMAWPHDDSNEATTNDDSAEVLPRAQHMHSWPLGRTVPGDCSSSTESDRIFSGDVGAVSAVIAARVEELLAEAIARSNAGDPDGGIRALRKAQVLRGGGAPLPSEVALLAELELAAGRPDGAERAHCWLMANCERGTPLEIAARRRYASGRLSVADAAADAGRWEAAVEEYKLCTSHQPTLTVADRNVMWRCFRGRLRCALAFEDYAAIFEATGAVLGRSDNLQPLVATR